MRKYGVNLEKFNKKADVRDAMKCPYGLSFVSWIRCRGNCKMYYEVEGVSRCLQEDIRNHIYYRIEKGEEK